MFDELNIKYWGGFLPPLELIGTRAMEDYGEYCHPKNPTEDTPDKYKILVNLSNQNKGEQRITLLHEMCHHAVFLRFKEKHFKKQWSWHGREWKKEMRRVGFKGKINKFT